MRLRRLPGLVGSFVGYCVWWATIGPFCVASDLPRLGSAERRPIRLASEPDQYPITELLGRILWFRSRLRWARALVILWRGAIFCAFILVVARASEVLTHRPPTAW